MPDYPAIRTVNGGEAIAAYGGPCKNRSGETERDGDTYRLYAHKTGRGIPVAWVEDFQYGFRGRHDYAYASYQEYNIAEDIDISPSVDPSILDWPNFWIENNDLYFATGEPWFGDSSDGHGVVSRAAEYHPNVQKQFLTLKLSLNKTNCSYHDLFEPHFRVFVRAVEDDGTINTANFVLWKGGNDTYTNEELVEDNAEKTIDLFSYGIIGIINLIKVYFVPASLNRVGLADAGGAFHYRGLYRFGSPEGCWHDYYYANNFPYLWDELTDTLECDKLGGETQDIEIALKYIKLWCEGDVTPSDFLAE